MPSLSSKHCLDLSHAVSCQSNSSGLDGVLTPPKTPENGQNVEKGKASLTLGGAEFAADPSDELTEMISVDIGLRTEPKEALQKILANGSDVEPMSIVPQLPQSYQGSYHLLEELGHGAWSVVYRGIEMLNSTLSGTGIAPDTPPDTPEISKQSSEANVLAVKVLARRDGKQILEQEACILTYLHSRFRSARHLVPFHGYDSSRCSIVMTCVPLTLEEHITDVAKAPFTTMKMYSPIIGAEGWSVLAIRLIDCLKFLQENRCVHGDVKPANILLQDSTKTENKTFQPLLCDFSSSQVLNEDSSCISEEVTAVTTEFTAPEILHALSPRRRQDDERAVCTYSTDIFSLGVTLLFAATGESPYAQARIRFQRTAMAEQGVPLQYAQTGDQALRVRQGKAVEQILRDALQQDGKQRVPARAWQERTKKIIGSWRDNAWVEGR